jgi:hypothetical protein
MVKTPFHRKILPWMFIIIFLMMAPAVIFYTSGYRWNAKKHAIERNGTLIIDTFPQGASIKLNGQQMPETTSVTLQNMSPGSYDIKLDLQDYHPWSKTLWIDPERVTFASGIVLWPQLEPEYVGESSLSTVWSDADSGGAIVTGHDTASTTFFGIINPKNSQIEKRIQTNTFINVNQIDWNPRNESEVLVYDNSQPNISPWLLQFNSGTIIELPAGTYHWQQDGLIGQNTNTQITVSSDQTVSKETKAPSLIDSLDNWRLSLLNQNQGEILSDGDDAKEGYILPQGQWQFWYGKNNILILQSANHWLWIDTNKNPSVNTQATGDLPLPITIKRLVQLAYKNNNEAWVWLQGQEPELIYRQSDPLVSVSWHAQGRDLMVATKNEILIFSLDDRNGRSKTSLTTFDDIKSATINGDNVFIVGTKNGQTGLWKLPLAIKSNSLLQLGFNL